MLVVPAGQLAVPEVQATLLLPPVMELNARFELLLAASAYSIGLTLPRPFEEVAWPIRARIPANVGAPAEVPPTAEKLLLESRNPLVQSPGPQVK